MTGAHVLPDGIFARGYEQGNRQRGERGLQEAAGRLAQESNVARRTGTSSGDWWPNWRGGGPYPYRAASVMDDGSNGQSSGDLADLVPLLPCPERVGAPGVTGSPPGGALAFFVEILAPFPTSAPKAPRTPSRHHKGASTDPWGAKGTQAGRLGAFRSQSAPKSDLPPQESIRKPPEVGLKTASEATTNCVGVLRNVLRSLAERAGTTRRPHFRHLEAAGARADRDGCAQVARRALEARR